MLIVCLLFSGCISYEDGNTSEASYSSETDSGSIQIPDIIVDQDDIPGRTLNSYFFYAVPENDIYTRELDNVSKYTDALPLGARNVGEKSYWMDVSGQRAVAVEIERYDSDEGMEYIFNNWQEWTEILKEAEQHDANLPWEEYETDTCDFGTNGYYESESPLNDPDISHTTLIFMTSNNELVTIHVRDERGNDLDEAMRIAEMVEDRL